MLRQLIHHLPATSPYEPRHLHVYATEVQRLTTAPPWRHAPRFFLAAAPVANRPTNRDVPPQTPWNTALGAPTVPVLVGTAAVSVTFAARPVTRCAAAPVTVSARRPVTVAAGRRTPPDCRRRPPRFRRRP
ncbi:hypothetical protein EF917_20860 [Streptomyces sp. WAC00469]|nr:hypothetical protein EF917_20860 [Streptomyces sp. WAC00469]